MISLQNTIIHNQAAAKNCITWEFFSILTQIVQRQSYIKFCERPTRNNNNNSQLNFRVQKDGKILLCLYSFSIFLCTRLKVVILFFKIKR